MPELSIWSFSSANFSSARNLKCLFEKGRVRAFDHFDAAAKYGIILTLLELGRWVPACNFPLARPSRKLSIDRCPALQILQPDGRTDGRTDNRADWLHFWLAIWGWPVLQAVRSLPRPTLCSVAFLMSDKKIFILTPVLLRRIRRRPAALGKWSSDQFLPAR